MHARVRDERGQGALVAMSGIVMVVLATLVVTKVMLAATEQSRAQHAADAAALAGVSGGVAAAVSTAAANGADLLSFTRTAGRAGGTVRVSVTVGVGERVARAVAEGDDPMPRGRSPTGGGTPRRARVLYARTDVRWRRRQGDHRSRGYERGHRAAGASAPTEPRPVHGPAWSIRPRPRPR